MTRREVAKKRKNDVNIPTKPDPEPYCDSVGTDESEGSEDLVLDCGSDSDASEIDKNNNLTPLPLPGFTDRSISWDFQQQGREGIFYEDVMMRSAQHSLRKVTSDSQYSSAGCTSSEEILSQDEGQLISSSKETDDSDGYDSYGESSTRKKIGKDETAAVRKLRLLNANENNNSNRKKLRSRGSRGSQDVENNNNNRKLSGRSVQLSSVRVGKAIYKDCDLKPYKSRMISKDGSSNIHMKKSGKLDWFSRYSKDIYTTLVDLNPFWIIFLTTAVYVGHWIIFGFIYWIFAIVNNDDAKINGYNVTQTSPDGNFTTVTTVYDDGEPCVSNVYDFVSAFLFSMESETTIGYGSRSMGTMCPGAVTCLVIQCVLSAIFDTWVIGMCFAKIARPDLRCRTIMYAKNAVICRRDGKKCLIVRVANLRKSLLMSVSCRARVITLRAPQRKEQIEGHQFVLEQKELEFVNANCCMFTAPIEYQHIIDKDSPLYTIPEKCLASEGHNWFEVVIILNGVIEATGMTVHAQTSYLSSEIKYKHRYIPIISIGGPKNRYNVDFKHFHDTEAEPLRIPDKSVASKGKSTDMRFEALAEMDEEESDDVFEPITNNNYQHCNSASHC